MEDPVHGCSGYTETVQAISRLFPLNAVPCDLPFPHLRSQFRTRDGEQQRLLNAAERTARYHAHAFIVPGIVEIDAADNGAQSSNEQAIDRDSAAGRLPKQYPIPLSAPLRTGTLIAAFPESGRADGPRMRRQIDPYDARHAPEPPFTRAIAAPGSVEYRGISGESRRVWG